MMLMATVAVAAMVFVVYITRDGELVTPQGSGTVTLLAA
jgi:hypothetical protein